ncbi:fumarate reductase subunit FrdC [Volucribacter amazonae]|uniref:Fumarate reductase subunit C n=1 Tax=Volucribacter amazonae TaxID=256731 RepID=A0A9X4PGJ3_9PAST|nr:fumarate reductase subunit FrdC [Volucribacter amazonae]MDG6894760.1 fumarate reductase subunit C [Volucribacter amazonae]
MTTTTSKRRKYVREIKANWWTKLDFYKLYVFREATAIPTLWFSLILFYGVICLGGGVESVKQHFIPFLQNPVVVILNVITLAAVLLNTVTYYVMTPKVLNIVVKNERLNPNIITIGLWIATALVSIIALVLIYR